MLPVAFPQKGSVVADSTIPFEKQAQALGHLQQHLDRSKKRIVERSQIHFIMELRLARGLRPEWNVFLGWLFEIDDVHYEVYDNGEIHERPVIEDQAS